MEQVILIFAPYNDFPFFNLASIKVLSFLGNCQSTFPAHLIGKLFHTFQILFGVITSFLAKKKPQAIFYDSSESYFRGRMPNPGSLLLSCTQKEVLPSPADLFSHFFHTILLTIPHIPTSATALLLSRPTDWRVQSILPGCEPVRRGQFQRCSPGFQVTAERCCL